ncbi:hypothetical protein [Streptomyces sp. NBC_00158]|uniref:hypothetical protein n=1 Tax=Streptomyces sp. NBC_00158 TaxID=2903627 RepID=UPI0032564649
MRPIPAVRVRIPFLASGGATAALLVTMLGGPGANALDRVLTTSRAGHDGHPHVRSCEPARPGAGHRC